MENNRFEKRKKGIINILNIMLWAGIIGLAGQIFFKILYLLNLIKYDLTDYTLVGYIISIIYVVFMFFSVNLAKKGSMAAGIIGIVMGIMEILLGGLIWKIFGALLVIDSIIYLIYYNKTK